MSRVSEWIWSFSAWERCWALFATVAVGLAMIVGFVGDVETVSKWKWVHTAHSWLRDDTVVSRLTVVVGVLLLVVLIVAIRGMTRRVREAESREPEVRIEPYVPKHPENYVRAHCCHADYSQLQSKRFIEFRFVVLNAFPLAIECEEDAEGWLEMAGMDFVAGCRIQESFGSLEYGEQRELVLRQHCDEVDRERVLREREVAGDDVKRNSSFNFSRVKIGFVVGEDREMCSLRLEPVSVIPSRWKRFKYTGPGWRRHGKTYQTGDIVTCSHDDMRDLAKQLSDVHNTGPF